MITHIVFFKFKDKANAQIAGEKLMAMKGKIDQLRYIEVGVDVLHSERSYDLALITKFDSLEDLQAYQVHPVHVEVANWLATVRESIVAVDYQS